MPITLPTLFTTPQDVWDWMSVTGVELREDDNNLATGQIITTATATPAGSTAMQVAALPVPLLAGAQLSFDGGGMAAPVTVQLAAPAAAGATTISVVATAADVAAGAQARDSGVNAATGARLLVGCRKGTSRVKLYCNARYDDSELARAGSVLDWATVIAAEFFCTRKGQSPPKSVARKYEEALEELRMVQAGKLSIEDIGTRGGDWPQVINVIVNPAYDGMRARVQPNISEGTPTAYGQYIDWNSAVILNP